MSKEYTHDTQPDEFEEMIGRVRRCMWWYGLRHGFRTPIDYELFEDDWGRSQVKIDILNLNVLSARLINKLRRQLIGRKGWEVVVSIALEDHMYDWPEMGLLVREHEVVDELVRSYFPPEFRSLAFERARPARDGDLGPRWWPQVKPNAR